MPLRASCFPSQRPVSAAQQPYEAAPVECQVLIAAITQAVGSE